MKKNIITYFVIFWISFLLISCWESKSNTNQNKSPIPNNQGYNNTASWQIWDNENTDTEEVVSFGKNKKKKSSEEDLDTGNEEIIDNNSDSWSTEEIDFSKNKNKLPESDNNKNIEATNNDQNKQSPNSSWDSKEEKTDYSQSNSTVCTFKNDEDKEVITTAYLKWNDIFLEDDDKNSDKVMLIKDEVIHLWWKNDSKWTQVKMRKWENTLKIGKTKISTSSQLKEEITKISNDCKEQIISDSMFELPSNITFSYD